MGAKLFFKKKKKILSASTLNGMLRKATSLFCKEFIIDLMFY